MSEREPRSKEASRPTAGGAKRAVLVGLGWVFCALGALGVPLPGLPTTPFLLLAAACFARSSPRFHRALLESPMLGPYLRHWQADRSVPRRAKRRAYALIAVTFAISISLAPLLWVRISLGVLGVGLCLFLHRLRTTESAGESAGASEPLTSRVESRVR